MKVACQLKPRGGLLDAVAKAWPLCLSFSKEMAREVS